MTDHVLAVNFVRIPDSACQEVQIHVDKQACD